MKTTIQILGAAGDSTPKPIKIMAYLDVDGDIDNTTEGILLKDFEYITLICKGYCDIEDGGTDLILLSLKQNPSEDPDHTILCLGKWNDGKL